MCGTPRNVGQTLKLIFSSLVSAWNWMPDRRPLLLSSSPVSSLNRKLFTLNTYLLWSRYRCADHWQLFCLLSLVWLELSCVIKAQNKEPLIEFRRISSPTQIFIAPRNIPAARIMQFLEKKAHPKLKARAKLPSVIIKLVSKSAMQNIYILKGINYDLIDSAAWVSDQATVGSGWCNEILQDDDLMALMICHWDFACCYLMK